MIGHFGGLKKLPPRLYRRVLGNWPDANGETSLRSRFQSKETDAKAKKKTHTHTQVGGHRAWFVPPRAESLLPGPLDGELTALRRL